MFCNKTAQGCTSLPDLFFLLISTLFPGHVLISCGSKPSWHVLERNNEWSISFGIVIRSIFCGLATYLVLKVSICAPHSTVFTWQLNGKCSFTQWVSQPGLLTEWGIIRTELVLKSTKQHVQFSRITTATNFTLTYVFLLYLWLH